MMGRSSTISWTMACFHNGLTRILFFGPNFGMANTILEMAYDMQYDREDVIMKCFKMETSQP